VPVSCDKLGLRLWGRADDGVYLDVHLRCMKPTCEICWLPLHNLRIKATRFQLQKVGIQKVWIGLVTEKERSTVRTCKQRLKDGTGPTPMTMLTTYVNYDRAGLLATVNLLPSSDTLTELPLNEALALYHGWGKEYRPKRVSADWSLKLKTQFLGKFTASRQEIKQVWKLLDKRYGYKPGSVYEDETSFERRAYAALDDVREAKRQDKGYP